MIVPVWKKIGESTHLLAKKTGEKIAEETNNSDNKKATHTGTLDPMAEGVVVVLTGEDRFKKADFSDWEKTYEFEILFGVNTDSLDILGLQNNLTTEIIDADKLKKQVEKIIPSFLGKQKQQQPKFSAQRVNGRSGFDLAKQQQRFEIKTNDVEILSLKILSHRSETAEELEKTINEKISLVNGDFRQKEILDNWKKTFSKLKKIEIKSLPIIKFKAEVSKRTYVRSLVRDISQKIGLPAATFSIIRTKNGEYKREKQ